MKKSIQMDTACFLWNIFIALVPRFVYGKGRLKLVLFFLPAFPALFFRQKIGKEGRFTFDQAHLPIPFIVNGDVFFQLNLTMFTVKK